MAKASSVSSPLVSLQLVALLIVVAVVFGAIGFKVGRMSSRLNAALSQEALTPSVPLSPSLSPSSSPLSDAQFINPIFASDCPTAQVVQRFSSTYGGLNIAGKTNCWVHAAGAGKVISVGSDENYGYNVTIDHGNNLVSFYSHGDAQPIVKVGDQVAQGQNLMYMGSSGRSTGVHLHLEFRKNGVQVNPEKYIELL
jgi:murein DD-endopeptidase MepM/ murein hydrolase activator NlpD